MQSNLDPITIAGHTVAATIGAMFGVPVSAVLADALGAYIVIAVVAALGAGWALGARPQTGRVAAAWYFVRVTATASLLTVVLAGLANLWLGLESERLLIIPMAFCLGMVGDNWPRVRAWVIAVVVRVLTGRFGGRS